VHIILETAFPRVFFFCRVKLHLTQISALLSLTTDFSIYHDDIRAADPSGVQLRGLDKYKSAVAFFQTFLGFWFSSRGSTVQFRMVYDECRSAIRISWNARLVPKLPVMAQQALHVDAVSYYQMDAPSGKIVEHKIEKLIMNSADVEPPYGILSLLQQDALRLVNPPQGQPQGAGAGGMAYGAAASVTTTASAAMR